jgi:hypothetical protein
MNMKTIVVAELWVILLGCFTSSVHSQGGGNSPPAGAWVAKAQLFPFTHNGMVRVTIDVTWEQWEVVANTPTRFRRLKLVWTLTADYQPIWDEGTLSFAGKTITGTNWVTAGWTLPTGVTMFAKYPPPALQLPPAEPKELIWDSTEHNENLSIDFTETITGPAGRAGTLRVLLSIPKN